MLAMDSTDAPVSTVVELATGHFFPSPSQCLRPTRFSQFSMPLLGEWLGLPFTVHIHHPSAPLLCMAIPSEGMVECRRFMAAGLA